VLPQFWCPPGVAQLLLGVAVSETRSDMLVCRVSCRRLRCGVGIRFLRCVEIRYENALGDSEGWVTMQINDIAAGGIARGFGWVRRSADGHPFVKN